MGAIKTLTRRAFLIGSTVVAGGVAFGTYAYRKEIPNPLLSGLSDDEVAISPYVKITPEGVTLITPRADKGQGAYSVQAHLIAEELDVDPHQVAIDPGQPDPAYYNAALLEEGTPFPAHETGWMAERMRGFMAIPAKLLSMQMTGGSSTVPDSYEKLRLAGAIARETLKKAAAIEHNEDMSTLKTENGHVILSNGKQIPYTSLAASAASIEPVRDVQLRSPNNWKYLGKRDIKRIDMQRKCTGTEQYGIDMVFEGMLYASVRANPALTGGVKSFDAATAKTLRGVSDVIPVKNGIAVVADNTWRAFKAVNAIEVEWEDGSQPEDQQTVWNVLSDAFDQTPDIQNKNVGDAASAIENASTLIEAEYKVPYLAHAPLEPMNAVVLCTEESCSVWTGTQIPAHVQEHVANLTGFTKDKVHVHVLPMGGSFGRRLEDTYVLQAVEIAMAKRDVPIKMTWTREEDMTHDYPRPAQMARAQGVVSDKVIDTLDFHVASSSVMESQMKRLLGAPIPGPDVTIVSGAWDQPFDIPNYRVTGYRAPEMVQISSWRSVGNSGVGFMHGSFLDELIHQAGLDPMDALISMCTHDLSKAVLEDVKALSGWDGSRISNNRARGVAFTQSFSVPTAEVVEVLLTDNGIRIEKLFVSCEVGKVMDPVNLEAQLMGGALFGLGHAMNCELTYQNQHPQQTNFHQYQAMRLRHAPEVFVNALENGDKVRGIGEPGLPPAAAALGNAIFALTGQRIRELPMHHHIEFA